MSADSTDAALEDKEQAPAKPAGGGSAGDRGTKVRPEQPRWLSRLTDHAWLLIPLLLPVAVIVGMIQGPGAAFLVLIAAALITVIALFWSSVRTLLGETPLSGADAYALAAPRAEEEQKQAVLRALKDLEFERSVGKISDEDYAVLVAKYRTEAKRLLRVLEETAKPRRERVERLVYARLVDAGLESMPATHRSNADVELAPDAKPKKKKKAKGAVKPAEKAAQPERIVEIEPLDVPPGQKASIDTTWKSAITLKTKESPAYTPPTKKCQECRAKNDLDAVFCKKCGSKAFDGEGETVSVKKDDGEGGEAAAENEGGVANENENENEAKLGAADDSDAAPERSRKESAQ